MIKNLISNGWFRFANNTNLRAALVLIFFLVIFYKDVVFYDKTFLIETAAAGTMPIPKGGPYNYDGVTPGFVANDPGAIAWQIEPFNKFISISFKKGDFPLWNPYAGLAGSPLLADGHTGPLEPIQFLFYITPGRFWIYVVDIQLLFRFFLAGFFCYLFAQRQKIGFLGSVSAGLLFMLSSYFVTFGNHPQIKTETLLPLVLYGYDRLADLKDRKAVWFCALFIGWAIIAAMPESTLFPLFLGTLWYFYRSILHWMETGRNFSEARKTFLRYVGSTILGFFISAVYLLPFLEFVSLAKSVHSAGGGGYAFPLSALPNLIFQVAGSFHLQIGFFALFCLIFSMLSLKDWPLSSRRHVVFFGLYAIIFILAIYDFPLTNWIRRLPVFNQIAFWKYPVPSIAFCLAILTGMFIDRIIYFPLMHKKLLLSALLVFTVFIGLPMLGDSSKNFYNYFIGNSLADNALELIVGVSIVLIILIYLYGRQEVSARVMQICLLLFVVSEPFLWRNGISRPNRIDPFQPPPFVNYLRDDNEPFRIFGLDGILYPNVSTAYRIGDIRWLNALVPQRAFDFSTRLIQNTEPSTMRFTGTALPVSDEMFDLLNVKYILDAGSSIKNTNNCLMNVDVQQPYFGAATLNNLILEQNPDKKDVLLSSSLDIDGITNATLLAIPPQEFQLKLTVPEASPALYFSVGLNPEVFQSDRGDGVDFQVDLLENGNRSNLFSKYIDPKNNPCDRKWVDAIINLDQWVGKEVTLSFSTSSGPVGDSSWDWAYWGGLNWEPAFELEGVADGQSDYNLVYQSHGVNIFQNENVFPRAFVVYQVVGVSDFDEAVEILSDPEVDLRQTGVVENLPMEKKKSIDENNQQMQSVAGSTRQVKSGELEVTVNTRAPGLLIVTDQYYPGWKAYVDGKSTPIYAVNGIFRGVFLEEGEHKVQFKYRPLSFIIGAITSSISLLVAIFFIISKPKVQPNKND
jgi:hypothetical protein